MFYVVYFFSTGLHALHVIVGMSLLTWVAVRCWQQGVLADLLRTGGERRASTGTSSTWCGSSSTRCSTWSDTMATTTHQGVAAAAHAKHETGPGKLVLNWLILCGLTFATFGFSLSCT